MEQYTLATPGCNATTQHSTPTAALPLHMQQVHALVAGMCMCSRFMQLQHVMRLQQVYAVATGIRICNKYMQLQQVYAYATGSFTYDRYMG